MNDKLKYDHFNNTEELLQNIDIWYKTDDIYYTRWFGLNDLNNLRIYINQLQSKWNSLRELIEQRIYLIEPKGTCINFYCEYDSEDDYVQGMKEQARLNTLKFILDKMNELESGEKN